MRKVAVFLLVLVSLPVFAADPAEEVRQAEIAFAKAFADRDAAKFFSFVADDATFLGGLRTLRGRQAVIERWSDFFKGPKAPFSWGPERVSVNAAGNIGLSTGPVFDPNGKLVSNYDSTWIKQPDGSWKILFDGGGPSAAPFAEDAIKVEEGFLTTDDGVKLHYRKAGEGPITLIIPLEFVMFDDFRQFADIATVIAFDLRDRGKSQAVKNVTLQNDLDDIEAVRKHFNVEKFVPIGYSYLGKAVVMYALAHPDRVTRVVQLGPAPMRDMTEYPASLQHGLDDMGVDHMKTYRESLKKANLTDEEVKKLTVPVLVVHGMKDRNAPYGSGREWAMTLPDARLVTVAGAAHQSWSDDPATVFAAIRQFLRREWPMGSEKVTKLEPGL
jgi:pimeloyl-ACP methyl ester carboxylesterase/ketosteroid isomerase-like protein